MSYRTRVALIALVGAVGAALVAADHLTRPADTPETSATAVPASTTTPSSVATTPEGEEIHPHVTLPKPSREEIEATLRQGPNPQIEHPYTFPPLNTPTPDVELAYAVAQIAAVSAHTEVTYLSDSGGWVLPSAADLALMLEPYLPDVLITARPDAYSDGPLTVHLAQTGDTVRFAVYAPDAHTCVHLAVDGETAAAATADVPPEGCSAANSPPSSQTSTNSQTSTKTTEPADPAAPGTAGPAAPR